MEKQSRFEHLFEILPCGICKVAADEDFTILNANSFYYKLYGYTSAQAAEEGFVNVRHILPPQSYGKIHDQVMEYIRAEKRYFELEFQGVRRGGELRWLLVSCLYEPAEPESFICVLLDISERKEMEKQLRMSMEESKIAFELTDKLMYVFDVKTRTLRQPKAVADLFGLPTVLENVPYSTLDSGSIDAGSRDNYFNFYKSILDGCPFGETVVKKRKKDGEYGWYSAKFSTVFDDSGEPARGIIACEDITEQHEKELTYRKWSQHFDSEKNMRDGYYEFNLTEDILEKSSEKGFPPYIEQTDNYTKLMVNFGECFVCKEDRSKFYGAFDREKLLGRFYEGCNEYEVEYRMIKPDGKMLWKKASLQMLSDPYNGDIRMFMMVRDVTEEKTHALELQKRVENDTLTGLLNRSTFLAKVNEILAVREYSARHALIMIDADHFKEVNDTFGHQFGDEVLCRIADAMKRIVRQGDFCGRLGGDEFVIFMNDVPTETVVSERMEKLCADLEEQHDGTFSGSVSAGVSFYPRNGLSFEELYQKADMALYAAKDSGRSTYRIYRESMENTRTVSG